MKRIKIALVGDFDEKMYTHAALNESINHCRSKLSFKLDAEWILSTKSDSLLSSLADFHGLWITPGSPYLNNDGVYEIIKQSRVKDIPVMGSCGGFQYMLIEYARNVLNLDNVGHEESDPGANHIISKLSCSLKGKEEEVFIRDRTSWLYEVLKVETTIGRYYCSYGINGGYQRQLDHFPLVFTAFSATGEVRAFELKGHRFFKGTLFQPPLDSSPQQPNPLILNFFKTCALGSRWQDA
jgi:CTP synthase (UTP-ammonia lyase)